MVHLRVIQGGRQEKSESVSASGLYKAYSVGNFTKDDVVYYDVKFSWYCPERSESGREAVIRAADTDLGELSAGDISRCFTKEETDALDEYLSERYGMSVMREEILLPLKGERLFFEDANVLIYDFLELSEQEGYRLPFKVWGYYSLKGVLSSLVLEDGVRFLRKALSSLDPKGAATPEQLESVVKKIHDEDGLVVRDRTREE